MDEEEKQGYMQNCYEGLKSLDKMLNSMLEDSELSKDKELLETKEKVGDQIDILGSHLEKATIKKK